MKTKDCVIRKIESARVLPVLVIDDASQALHLAETLLASGIRAIELTLRTEAALESLRIIRRSLPEMLIGIGTVLRPHQVELVSQEGADFVLSPGLNPRVVEATQKEQLPMIPGVATPSDIEAALVMDCKVLKLFPSEPLGGLSYLRCVSAPYQHLGIKFIPLGGISQVNLADYLREKSVSAVGGSWITPRQLIREGDWKRIKQLACEAVRTVADTQD